LALPDPDCDPKLNALEDRKLIENEMQGVLYRIHQSKPILDLLGFDIITYIITYFS